MPQLPAETALFLTNKRERKATRRRMKKQRWQLLRDNAETKKWARFGQRSAVIGLLAHACDEPLPVRRHKIFVKIPKNFSVIESPTEVIRLVTSFAASIRQNERVLHRCEFDHSDMLTYDLASNALLDIVAVEFEMERKRRKARKRFQVAGMFPRDRGTRRFVRALGIIKHLDIKHEAPAPNEAKALRIHDARNRSYECANISSDKKSREAERFVEHIDKCLATNGRTLTDAGKYELSSYLGEILSNAEEHADFMDWSILGYLDTSLSVPFCEIAIFNFGKTISETLAALSPASYTREQISEYLNLHRQSGFFNTAWRECDLLTVIALQGNVSRLNHSRAETRGQGTVDLIHFFEKVHSECCGSLEAGKPKMAILSGSTHILFDGKYKMTPNEHGVKVIAFNPSNNLKEKPDPRYVTSLGGLHFPGTIISIRFPLPVTDGLLVEEADHG